MDYRGVFAVATGGNVGAPYPYQQRLAESPTWPLVLDVPTGLGKTEAIVLGWIYRRLAAPETTPRRLIYVLPQRTLVEQTARRVRSMVDNLVAGGIDLGIGVEVLMGGEVGDEYLANPEAASILIGTQDMLLSRALNRGYAMSPFAWPMAFAWLHSDAWWVLDEVQLQGVGVTTAAQLQGLRSKLGSFGATATLFASATLDRSWIDTIDHPVGPAAATITLDDDDRAHANVRKRLNARKTAHRLGAYEPKAVAAAVLERHAAGTRSLVILNTVDRAVKTAAALRSLAPSLEVVLLHSRFRLEDRERHLGAALAPVDPGSTGRVVVATQVVEAGVDFSARLLVSDVAPWSSIVQRLGRCNRAGDDEEATFLWMEPPELESKTVAPYALSDVTEARDRLVGLEGADLAPSALPHVSMRPEPGATLRRVDLLELFDTSPDLSGNDIDVSRFIRDADDFTVRVLWRTAPPSEDDEPRREELCPATLGDVNALLKRLGVEKRRELARVSRPTSDAPWTAIAQAGSLRVGDIVWIAAEAGGYAPETGFDSAALRPVRPVARDTAGRSDVHGSETIESDARSFTGEATSIEAHSNDAVAEARSVTAPLVASGLLDERLAAVVTTSARWHDAGKAHPVFQATMARAGVGSIAGPWAKSDGSHSARHERHGFRHELVSALAWLAANDGVDDVDLIAYLIMAHHGKIRLAPQRLPMESSSRDGRTICGVTHGEAIPMVQLGAGVASESFAVDLGIFDVGSDDGGTTWGDRVGTLCDDSTLGIFRMAYLESLVRVADWRASAVRHEAKAPA